MTSRTNQQRQSDLLAGFDVVETVMKNIFYGFDIVENARLDSMRINLIFLDFASRAADIPAIPAPIIISSGLLVPLLMTLSSSN